MPRRATPRAKAPAAPVHGELPDTPAASRDRRRAGLALAVVVVIVVAATLIRAGGYGFLAWDDHYHIVDNPHVNPPSWAGLKHVFTAAYGNLYIPVSYAFYAGETGLARAMGGGATLSPAVYRVGNVALHAACVVLVYLVLRRLGTRPMAACAGAALFGVHPFQVESVAWLSETRGLLAAALCLMAIRAHLGPAETSAAADRSWRQFGWATAWFVLALLSKPSAAALPLMVGVIDVLLRRRPARAVAATVLPWVALAVVLYFVTSALQPARGGEAISPAWARPLVAADAATFYLGRLVWPAALGVDYGRTPAAVLAGGVGWPAATAAVLAGLAGLCIWRRSRAAGAALAVFLAALSPVLGFVRFDHQSISTVADRYAYLAMLGAAMGLAAVLNATRRRWAGPAAWAALAILAAVSNRQLSYWRDDATLFAHALTVNPRSPLAHNNLGYWLVQAGRVEEGVVHYRAALAIDPAYKVTLVNLGVVEELRGDAAEAERLYRAAADADPAYATAHANIANLLANQGRHAEALPAADRAVELAPDDARRHYDRGVILTHLGRYGEAVACYEQALALQPDHAAARNNLAIVRRLLPGGSTAIGASGAGSGG